MRLFARSFLFFVKLRCKNKYWAIVLEAFFFKKEQKIIEIAVVIRVVKKDSRFFLTNNDFSVLQNKKRWLPLIDCPLSQV